VEWGEIARDLVAEPDLARRAANRIAVGQGFTLTVQQAVSAGLSRSAARWLVRQGAWTAPRRGVLGVLPAGSDGERVVAATSAALIRPGFMVSHESAAHLHGIDLLTEPQRPTLTCAGLNGRGRRGDLTVYGGTGPPAHATEWFGVGLTSVERTVVDLARNDRRQGLVAADCALRTMTNAAQLERVVDECARWPGNAQARAVLKLATPLSESALESLTKLLVADAGLPAPQLQARIADPLGEWAYRVDLLWPAQRLVLEADGLLK
jgi:hypothetical protein